MTEPDSTVIVDDKKDPSVELVHEVRVMTAQIVELTESIKTEFVKRKEIADVVTRKLFRRRAWFAAVIVFCTMWAGGVVMVGVSGYCFLQGQTREVCKVIPGYSKTMDRLAANREAAAQREVRIGMLENENLELKATLDALADQLNAQAEDIP